MAPPVVGVDPTLDNANNAPAMPGLNQHTPHEGVGQRVFLWVVSALIAAISALMHAIAH
jgi:hypothetical protein